jgi:hypothetical protein
MASRQREAYERALKAISLMRREDMSLRAAAHEAGTQQDTVRALAGQALIRTRRGRWEARPRDRLERRMLLYDRKGTIFVTVRSSATASRIGEYHNAVKKSLETGNRSKLRPFRGKSIVDAKGKHHRFVTSPTVIRRLARAGEFRFESIY